MTDSIVRYLGELRKALKGADSALVHDAVYDADEYLRSAQAAAPDTPEAEIVAAAREDYGAPKDIAFAYLEVENTVARALRAPVPKPGPSGRRRFFGILRDPRTWGAYAYLLLAVVTGALYFGVVVVGSVIGVGISWTIVGPPFLLLFIGVVRMLSLVEGRIVETLLAERMPRRPLLGPRGGTWWDRIKHWFRDRRTWTTMLYQALQWPLGVFYVVLFGGGLVLSVWAIVGPLVQVLTDVPFFQDDEVYLATWAMPLVMLAGLVLPLLLMHLARFAGRLHGRYAKFMLVGSLGSSGPGEV